MIHVLQPRKVGIAERWHAEFPAGIIAQELAAPFLDVERWIRQYRIKAHVREGVLEQRAIAVPADVAGDASDGEVHAGEAIGFRVSLLPKHGDIIQAPSMGEHEAIRLNIESARAAAGVINPAPKWLDHFHHQRDHAARRVLLSTSLALHRGELAEEKLIDAPEQVEVVGCAAEVEVREMVDQTAKHLGAEIRLAEDFWQHALKFIVVPLDGPHGIVEAFADVSGASVGSECAPAGLQWHPEHIVGLVLLWIILHGVKGIH